MDISLTKLPWYGQVGAFVALTVTGVGLFYYYYEAPARSEIAGREITLKALRADVAKLTDTVAQLLRNQADWEHVKSLCPSAPPAR